MNNMLCAKCQKRVAVIYITKFEGGKQVNEGYCLKCARDLHLPNMEGIFDKLGISPEEIDSMTEQMSEIFNPDEGFEPGGAQPFMPFMQGLFPAKQENKQEGEQQKQQKNTNTPKEPKKTFKFLSNYATNLTQKAKDGKMDNLIGRDKELERAIQILNRRQKNNPCLIGEPGVGKTAIAEGIAQRLANDDVPEKLKGKELYLLDMTALVAGTQFRGQFESRIKGLLDEVKREGNIILFIDELHNLIGSGTAEGSMNAANILKPALSRGEVQIIGATTFSEYRKYIEKDAALERRFQPVTVLEPSINDSIDIIMGIKKYYETFHRVKITGDIATRCVSMSERYITDRYLPDKAIDLLDEACSCAVIANKDLQEYDKYAKDQSENKALLEKLETMEEPPYEQIASVKAAIAQIGEELKRLEPTALNQPITISDLAHVIELWTGIPAQKITETEAQKVVDLASKLKQRVIGQDEAVEKVASAVKRTRIRLSEGNRPASFIFVGPTGVGKTELVKQLSEQLFDSTEPLIRVDMSEYMEKHTVSRLVGSPPGYVGYDEAGQLTEKVRRKPYSVVLFDEIEKAHPDVLNILLQILDEGFVTDAQGRKVNFANTVIVMTSNAGSTTNGSIIGFDKSSSSNEYEKVMKALREFLRPEFLGRVDEVVVFNQLSEESLSKIALIQLEDLKKSLNNKGVSFSYTEDVAKLIAKKSYDGKSGAREIRKVIRSQIEDPMVDLLLTQSISAMALDVKDGEFRIESL